MTAVIWQWRAAVAARDEARRTLNMASKAVNTYFKRSARSTSSTSPGCSPCGRGSSSCRSPTSRSFADRRPTTRRRGSLANAYYRWGMITGALSRRKTASGSCQRPSSSSRPSTAGPQNLDVRIGLARSYQAFAFEAVFNNQGEEGTRTARLAAELWAEVVRARPDDPEPGRSLGRSR